MYTVRSCPLIISHIHLAYARIPGDPGSLAGSLLSFWRPFHPAEHQTVWHHGYLTLCVWTSLIFDPRTGSPSIIFLVRKLIGTALLWVLFSLSRTPTRDHGTWEPSPSRRTITMKVNMPRPPLQLHDRNKRPFFTKILVLYGIMIDQYYWPYVYICNQMVSTMAYHYITSLVNSFFVPSLWSI